MPFLSSSKSGGTLSPRAVVLGGAAADPGGAAVADPGDAAVLARGAELRGARLIICDSMTGSLVTVASLVAVGGGTASTVERGGAVVTGASSVGGGGAA